MARKTDVPHGTTRFTDLFSYGSRKLKFLKLPSSGSTTGLALDPLDEVTLDRNDANQTHVKDGGIATAQLADGAVTTAKIAAGAVTDTELAADSVNAAHIQTGAVGSSEIADGAVTNDELDDDVKVGSLAALTTGVITSITAAINWLVSLVNAHHTRHESGGADAIKLDDLAAPDDNTDLNASTSAHGLLQKLPGGTSTFLRADGAFATPPGATTFLGLSDTPSDYSGNAGKLLQVKSDETGLEFSSVLGDFSVDTLTVEEQLLLPGTATATFSTNQTDLSPTNLAVASRVLLTIGATVEIYSFAGISDGRVLIVYNIGTNVGVFKKDNGALGTAAMRFILDHDIPLYPGTAIILHYDAGVSRWRILPLFGIKVGSGGAEHAHELDFNGTTTVAFSESSDNGVWGIAANVNDASIDTTQLADGAVTTAKLATGVVGWKTLSATADQAVINNSTPQSSTYLQFSMAANTKYRIRFYVMFDTTAAGDFKYTIAGPASPTLVRIERLHVEAGSSSPARGMLTAYPANIALTGTGTTFGYVKADMIVHNGANSGTFAFQFSQNSAQSDTGAIALAGSYMEYSIA